MSPTFADLGVSPRVVARLAERGIVEPFAIQIDAIPAALAGRDVCGRAPTGSGKTLAFGVPIVERVAGATPGRPRALVLAPTRELAAQIGRELRPLLQTRKRYVATFYGGVSFGPQLQALERGVDVVVACPGRLSDLVARGAVSLADVDLVVLDEADRMADMGFLPEVRRLLDQTRGERQTLLFSATLDGDVDVLVRRYQREPIRCEVARPADDDMPPVEHRFVATTRETRVAEVAKAVADHGSTVVFCRTKHGADRLVKQLGRAGVSAVAIHGNRSQNQRDRALKAFANQDVQALVATDVAARGIHVDDVACVVHFDLPSDAKDYIHRSGRTGRAGATGLVIALFTDTDQKLATQLQRDLGLVAPKAPPAGQRRLDNAAGRGRRSRRRPGGGGTGGAGRGPARRART